MNTPNFNLHIERLVLHGFKPMQKQQLRQSVQQELLRLIKAQGLSQGMYQSRGINRASVPTIRIRKYMRPRTLGQRIAGSVYKGVLR